MRAGPSGRMLVIGLVGTGLYAGVLGAGALAQTPAGEAPPATLPPQDDGSAQAPNDPTPEPSTTPEPPSATPEATATPEPTPELTPESTATVEATASPTPESTAPPSDPSPSAGAGTVTPAPPAHPKRRARQKVKHRTPPSRGQTEPKKRRSATRAGVAGDDPATRAAPAAPVSRDIALAPADPAWFATPDSLIDTFRVPPFLLGIYQAAAARYGVPWEVLAAINEIESDYGRNLGPSSAGAVGWMQFIPSTWDRYGVDANRDGVADPGNPVDAIFAAARYLRAAGAGADLRKAVFAYNHASWYVDDVLQRARRIGALPREVVASLTGLAQGRFPVRASARYTGRRTSIRIVARPGAAVAAVNDGRIVDVGSTKLLGRYVRLRDVYGNTYTYARLRRVGAGRSRSSKVRLFAHRPHGGGAIRITSVRPGMRVAAGSVLGRIGDTRSRHTAYMLFQIRPAGGPRIDPAPILDGWRALDRTGASMPATQRPAAKGPLAARVLGDARLRIYGCGRRDIAAGAIDPRVLTALEYLADSGLHLTISSLRCGHSYLTSSGNVSEHSSGTAVDIAAVNGIAIAGHQGAGSITETVVRRLLALHGTMKPHQIISLMEFPGADNTFAMSDHADHIHVGWRPAGKHGATPSSPATLTPSQWLRLTARLRRVAIPAGADSHRGGRRAVSSDRRRRHPLV